MGKYSVRMMQSRVSAMGVFDLFKKPDPQKIAKQLREAVAASDTLIQKGDKENALKVLLKHKDLGWDDTDYVMHIALAYYYAGHYPEAIECNKRAAELNSDYGRIYINMGRAYFVLRDYDNAAASYRQAIRLIELKPQSNQRSDHPIACGWYGASLVMKGKKEEGEFYFKKAEAEGYQKVNGLRKFVGLPEGTKSDGKKLLISKYGNGSAELVAGFERRFGISLDEEYRRFLIRYNGGYTPETRVKSDDFSSDVRYLYGLNVKKNIDEKMLTAVWLEKRCIPIGEDCFGNFFAIGTSESDKGSVYFCDHGKEFALTKIADSFGQFVNKCKSDEIDPHARMSPEEREAKFIAEGKAAKITDMRREMWKHEYEKFKDMIQEEVV